jgi:phosphoribosylformylglycinamidine synthase
MKATVKIFLKEDVTDVAGKTIKERLISLGFGEVKEVRVGKLLEIEIESADRENTVNRVQEMCSRLLVNSAIEESVAEVLS